MILHTYIRLYIDLPEMQPRRNGQGERIVIRSRQARIQKEALI